MNGVHLIGLEGTNPLGFLAALGVQVAFASETEQPRLWWSDDITPHAIVDAEFTMEYISEIAAKIFAEWSTSAATNPQLQKGDELKLKLDDIRTYLLSACAQGDLSGNLAASLVAEGSLNKQGKCAKPTALSFLAGQQKFLVIVRKILSNVKKDEVLESIGSKWRYKSTKKETLMWDIVDDSDYALSAYDPSRVKKHTNPGAEALAILGLSLHPVFASRKGIITQGCSGEWKLGYYSWPLWHKPATLSVVKSLLAHAYHDQQYNSKFKKHSKWFNSWSVSKVLRSRIDRSDQGGYGTFRPPEIQWKK